MGKKRSLPAHSPGRDHLQKRELLRQRFAEFGPEGGRFFDELLRARRNGKDEAARVLGLLTVYRREDLVRALERILAYRTPLRLLPVVEEFLRDMAPYEPPEEAHAYRNIRTAIEDKKFRQDVEKDESLNFLLRDTLSLTMMGGSEQTNVIPSEAWANLDVRILPGGDPRALLEQIRRVVDDPNVTVEPLNAEFRQANYSPTNTKLYEAIRKVSGKYFPGTPVVPHITSGYTENQRYRPLGIEAYGFTPYTATEEEGNTEHGNDERIRVEEVRRGPKILFDVVAAVAAGK